MLRLFIALELQPASESSDDTYPWRATSNRQHNSRAALGHRTAAPRRPRRADCFLAICPKQLGERKRRR
jgi:hypothetical protein